MDIDILTKDDLKRILHEFRVQMLEDIKNLIGQSSVKNEWLKSDEVRKMLKISNGTLQNLRIAGKLKPNKIGGTHYYRLADIEAMLTNGVK